jgi:hypothetical protein
VTVAASTGAALLALGILSVLVAGAMYAWDDFTRLLEEQAADEVGAGADRPGSGAEEPSVLGGTLTAAGANYTHLDRLIDEVTA